jgi:hypothetical protein
MTLRTGGRNRVSDNTAESQLFGQMRDAGADQAHGDQGQKGNDEGVQGQRE